MAARARIPIALVVLVLALAASEASAAIERPWVPDGAKSSRVRELLRPSRVAYSTQAFAPLWSSWTPRGYLAETTTHAYGAVPNAAPLDLSTGETPLATDGAGAVFSQCAPADRCRIALLSLRLPSAPVDPANPPPDSRILPIDDGGARLTSPAIWGHTVVFVSRSDRSRVRVWNALNGAIATAMERAPGLAGGRPTGIALRGRRLVVTWQAATRSAVYLIDLVARTTRRIASGAELYSPNVYADGSVFFTARSKHPRLYRYTPSRRRLEAARAPDRLVWFSLTRTSDGQRRLFQVIARRGQGSRATCGCDVFQIDGPLPRFRRVARVR